MTQVPTQPMETENETALSKSVRRGIATRKSALAMWQAREAKKLLEDLNFDCTIVSTETTGDRIQTSPLALNELPYDHPARRHVSTGKGLFIKEVQDLLLNEQCHLAVHSMKDLPVTQTEKLALAGFLPSASASDVLVLSPLLVDQLQQTGTAVPRRSSPAFLEKLQAAALNLRTNQLQISNHLLPVGTTSTRRQALLLKSGITQLPLTMLRGNVETRLKRLRNNEFSAIVLAEAGLRRLGLFDPSFMVELDPAEFVPACCQGVVGLETLATDTVLSKELVQVTSQETLVRTALERLTLFLLEGSCHSAIGIHFHENVLNVFSAKVPVSLQTPGITSMLNLESSGKINEAQSLAYSFKNWKDRLEKDLLALKYNSFHEIFESLKKETLFAHGLREWLNQCGHFQNIENRPVG